MRQPILSKTLSVSDLLHLEFVFDFIPLLQKDIEKLFALFLHVFLVFVYENRLHNHLIKPVHVLCTPSVNFLCVMLFFLVGVEEVFVAGFGA